MIKIFDDGDDDDDDDDCEQRLWIVTHGRIEVTLQCLWTFRGVAEKLDVDTATKTWLRLLSIPAYRPNLVTKS